MIVRALKKRLGSGDQFPSESSHREDRLACLSFLAYEARNHLSAIEQSLFCLLESATTLPCEAKSYGRLLQEIAHVRRLLDEVSASSPESLDLWLEPVELGPLIFDSIEFARPMFEAKCQSVLSVLDSNAIVVQGDRGYLVQVFTNLLSNASKYSPSHSRIEVSAYKVKGEAIINVKDEGIGFDAKQREQIHKVFRKVEAPEAVTDLRNNVGLSLVSKIVKLHKGSIDVKSEGLARGSEFTVRLPVDPESSEPDS